MRWLYILISVIIALLIIPTIWMFIKPLRISYRDVEMGIGSSRAFLMSFGKYDTPFAFAHFDLEFNLIKDGKQQQLPEWLTITNTDAGSIGRPSFFSRLYQYDLVEVSSSTTAPPGEYQIAARVFLGELRIATIPLEVKINKAVDDIVFTNDGPAYRANAYLPAEQEWDAITESRVQLANTGIAMTYRDTIEIRPGDYKAILVSLDMDNSSYKDTHISYRAAELINNQLRPFRGVLPEEQIQPHPGPEYKAVIPVKYRPIAFPYPSSRTHTLGIQVESEGLGVMGIVPFTLIITPSPEDVYPSPGGAYTYISHNTTQNTIFFPSFGLIKKRWY